MKHLPNTSFYATLSFYAPRPVHFLMITACMFFIVLLSACSGTGLSGVTTVAHTASLSSTATRATATTSTTYPIKVFFSKYPTSVNSDLTAVFPVDRVSPTLAVGAFSIQLLIAGPTPDEQKAGYFTELNTILSGPSTCTASIPVEGPDFTLTLNKRGTMVQNATATLQFCRATNSSGIGADARITAEINATLKQFSTIKNVVILTQSGHCFGDESGKDMCLK